MIYLKNESRKTRHLRVKGNRGKIDKRVIRCRNYFRSYGARTVRVNKKEVACLRVSFENINTQLKAFWDLEAIGIAESNEKNITDFEVIK